MHLAFINYFYLLQIQLGKKDSRTSQGEITTKSKIEIQFIIVLTFCNNAAASKRASTGLLGKQDGQFCYRPAGLANWRATLMSRQDGSANGLSDNTERLPFNEKNETP